MTEKYGFIYIWRDKKHNRYYIGCHWGFENDGYVCSSTWMKKAWKIRPEDFRRKILKTNIKERPQMYIEEQRYFDMIKPHEIKTRYYNLNLKNNALWHAYDENVKTIGQKISAAKKGKSTGPCSPEKAKAISEAKLAKQRKMSDETKQKLSVTMSGRTHTEERKQEISSSLKSYYENTESKSLGRKLSQEHKEAISVKLKSVAKTSYTHSEASKQAKLKSQQAASAALKGAKSYNNGTIEKRCKEHPGEGWVLGGLKRSK
jgi:preprotein translocase subunit SecD